MQDHVYRVRDIDPVHLACGDRAAMPLRKAWRWGEAVGTGNRDRDGDELTILQQTCFTKAVDDAVLNKA